MIKTIELQKKLKGIEAEDLIEVLDLCGSRSCQQCPRLNNGIKTEDECRLDLIRNVRDRMIKEWGK